MRLSGRKPVSFTRRLVHQPRIVLLTLFGFNIAVFVAQLSLQSAQPGFVPEFLALSSRGVYDAYAWQFLSALFLHVNAWHLLVTLFVLYVLGRDLETILGQRHFLYLYLAGAFSGELAHLFLMPPDCILYAASGGVAALLAAHATILPELELSSFNFFSLPVHLKVKQFATVALGIVFVLTIFDRAGTVIHSGFLGGYAAGWLYAHLSGFGRPSFVQRILAQRRATIQRHRHMDAHEFIAEEVDPLLEKISRSGLQSLTRREKRLLEQGRDKILES